MVSATRGRISDKAPLVDERSLEPTEHPVECDGQLLNLVSASWNGEERPARLCGDRVCTPSHRLNRPQRGGCQEVAAEGR